MTYFLKWHLSPKRDLNLGLKRQSTWIREISVLDHSATTAGLRYQRLCQEDTYFFLLEIIFLGKLYVSNKVGSNNIFSASYFFSLEGQNIWRRLLEKKFEKSKEVGECLFQSFYFARSRRKLAVWPQKMLCSTLHPQPQLQRSFLIANMPWNGACFLELRLRLRRGSK